jgi:hypothetical protein
MRPIDDRACNIRHLLPLLRMNLTMPGDLCIKWKKGNRIAGIAIPK